MDLYHLFQGFLFVTLLQFNSQFKNIHRMTTLKKIWKHMIFDFNILGRR